MKILLDACVWGGVRAALAAAGHDVIWAGDWPSDPGDEEILDQAAAENRVLVTLDKGFRRVGGSPRSGAPRHCATGEPCVARAISRLRADTQGA